MITLFLCCSTLFATPDEELITCKFLDEFFDYKISCTLQQENDLLQDEYSEDCLLLDDSAMAFEPNEAYTLTPLG